MYAHVYTFALGGDFGIQQGSRAAGELRCGGRRDSREGRGEVKEVSD